MVLFAVKDVPASLNSCAAREALDAIFMVGALARLLECDNTAEEEAVAL